MHSKLRRNFVGSFGAQRHSDSLWRLTSTHPAPVELFLRGAESRAANVLPGHHLHNLGIEWYDGRVLLTFTRGGGVADSLTASGIFVHEPAPDVLRALPLAPYDARARRFWQRVFFLVRVPGGRHLLGLIARRAR